MPTPTDPYPMYRRRFAAAATVSSLTLSAGCLGSLLGGITEHEAVPAVVDREAVSEAGFEYEGTSPMVERREFAGEEVEVTNYLSEYTRSHELDLFGTADAGVFALLSTPRISIAGREFNPVSDWSNREIAEQIQEQYEEFSIGETIGDRTVDLLDTTTDVETFDGEARLVGHGSLEVFMDVGQVDHADDHLVALGVYPQEAVDATNALDGMDALSGTSEAERIDTMIQNVRHDGEDVDLDVEDDA